MKPLVIKIGGAILESQSALLNLLTVIKSVADQKIVLVHGGGCVVDELLDKSGFITEKKQGVRVTPKEQMPIISGALAGFVNKSIVSLANSIGLTAVGLALSDGDMVACDLHPLSLGQVGVPKANNNRLLGHLLKHDFFPVISSIGALSHGDLVNVNADDAAVVICELLRGNLLLLTDVEGVRDGNGQWLASLNAQQAEQLINEGVIAGGMTAKVKAALKAAQQLQQSIAVASWKSPEKVKE